MPSLLPTISVHASSPSTLKSVQKSPTLKPVTHRSISDIQSNTTSVASRKSSHQTISSTVLINQAKTNKSDALSTKFRDNLESVWDLDEINRFTREMFSRSNEIT